MKGQIIFSILAFLALIYCESPSTEEKNVLVAALNRHRREASANNQLAHWDNHYANFSQTEVRSCRKVQTFPGVSDHVSRGRVDSNYLLDALEFWIRDGKEDARNGCPRFACNDYYVLISAHLKRIGCAYKSCPNLGGIYVVCRYDYILD